MKPDEARDLLADYLGDELDAAQQRQFEACLADDPALADEVDGLRQTLRAMRALDEPMVPATPPSVPPAARRGRLPVVFRYAAMIVLGFGAGHLTRNVGRGPRDGPPPPMVRPEPQDAASRWEARVAVAYARQPGRSGLARSLIALAQANRVP